MKHLKSGEPGGSQSTGGLGERRRRVRKDEGGEGDGSDLTCSKGTPDKIKTIERGRWIERDLSRR